MTARVTIGMPVYQNAATLGRAIASVRAQTFKDWILILTDDGSTDDCLTIAREAAEGDPRIELRRNPERLGYMNFGVSLQLAKTDWFVWLAGDDYWAPAFLEQCLSAIERRPDAVSVLPRWGYSGLGAPAPRTLPLEGTHIARVRRFLAAPGGTRMYGLTKRVALQAAFPRRAFNAYDWYLVLGLLRHGPQIEVPDVLLFRDRTPVRAYVETAAREHPGPAKSWPITTFTLAALRAGLVPARTLGDLARLNLRKHEEYLAYMKPDRFARRIGLFRTLGLPLSSKPQTLREIAAELAETRPELRTGASRLLERLLRDGDCNAGVLLGDLRERGVLPGDAAKAYRTAAKTGDPDAMFHLARCLHEQSELPDTAFWTTVLDAASSSRAAAAHLNRARAEGKLSPAVAMAADFRAKA